MRLHPAASITAAIAVAVTLFDATSSAKALLLRRGPARTVSTAPAVRRVAPARSMQTACRSPVLVRTSPVPPTATGWWSSRTVLPVRRESDEILYAEEGFAAIGADDIAALKRLAAANPRRRCRICTHGGPGAAVLCR